MKKITAFLVALVLLGGTIFAIHTEAGRHLNFNNPQFSYWTDNRKFQSPAAIRANLNKDSLVVLASSELQHGVSTPYHPQNMFKGNTFQPMLIGAGYYQTLSHAVTLAALEPSMEKRKVVLMVAPQWFRKAGVLPEAYSSRFSENSFLDMLDNTKLSKETKEYITDRSVKLLSADKAMQKRVLDYDNLYLKGEKNSLLKIKYDIYRCFLDDKEKQNIITAAFSSGITHKKETVLSSSEPDWNTYMTEAAEDAKAATSNNNFQISNKYYNFKIKPQLKKRKGSSHKSSYASSPEYDDLKCFLQVCKELDVEPMLILLPMNGRWYDYTDFPKERRDQFYENVKKVAADYPNAKITDFSNDDYTDYFMEDTVHIGWKGWVSINEILYKFGTQD